MSLITIHANAFSAEFTVFTGRPHYRAAAVRQMCAICTICRNDRPRQWMLHNQPIPIDPCMYLGCRLAVSARSAITGVIRSDSSGAVSLLKVGCAGYGNSRCAASDAIDGCVLQTKLLDDGASYSNDTP